MDEISRLTWMWFLHIFVSFAQDVVTSLTLQEPHPHFQNYLEAGASIPHEWWKPTPPPPPSIFPLPPTPTHDGPRGDHDMVHV